MPVNVKKWLEDRKNEIGLNDEEAKVAEKLLNTARFQSDFVPLPDFHSALGKQREKYEGEVQKLTELNYQWQEEYENKYAPALDAVQKLQSTGFDVRGVRNDGQGGVVTPQGTAFTAEDIDRMIAERVEPLRAGSVEYINFIADKSVEYREQFGKKFDADSYRKFAFEHRDQYPTFASAYEAFTADDRKAREESERKKWEAETEQRIRMEVMSNASIPEAAGVTGAPAFLATDTTPEPNRDATRLEFAKKFANADFTGI